jgi:hypothetical protein
MALTYRAVLALVGGGQLVLEDRYLDLLMVEARQQAYRVRAWRVTVLHVSSGCVVREWEVSQ